MGEQCNPAPKDEGINRIKCKWDSVSARLTQPAIVRSVISAKAIKLVQNLGRFVKTTTKIHIMCMALHLLRLRTKMELVGIHSKVIPKLNVTRCNTRKKRVRNSHEKEI